MTTYQYQARSTRMHHHPIRTRQSIEAVLYSTPQALTAVKAAITAKNGDEIVCQSHQLTADFKLIGADFLTKLTADLEQFAQSGDLHYACSIIESIRGRCKLLQHDLYAQSNGKHRGRLA